MKLALVVKIVIIVLSLLFSSLASAARQSSHLGAEGYDEGEVIPGRIFYDVECYRSDSLELSNFRGKWLVLYLWTRHCPSCPDLFPIYDTLQETLGEELNIVLAGYTGTYYAPWIGRDEDAVKRIYQTTRFKYNLKIPVVFDSLIFDNFNVGASPFIVVVDPAGVIRHKTWKLTKEDIRDLLVGKVLELPKAEFRKPRKN